MTNKLTQISKEDLASVIQARAAALELASAAEKALKDARVAELEYKVKVHELYINKGLHANCRIDMNSGAISWPEPEKATPPPEANDSKKVTKKVIKKKKASK